MSAFVLQIEALLLYPLRILITDSDFAKSRLFYPLTRPPGVAAIMACGGKPGGCSHARTFM
jgi:hypothetical protein